MSNYGFWSIWPAEMKSTLFQISYYVTHRVLKSHSQPCIPIFILWFYCTVFLSTGTPMYRIILKYLIFLRIYALKKCQIEKENPPLLVYGIEVKSLSATVMNTRGENMFIVLVCLVVTRQFTEVWSTAIMSDRNCFAQLKSQLQNL